MHIEKPSATGVVPVAGLALLLGLGIGGCGEGEGSLQPEANRAPILQAQGDTAGVRGDTLRLTARATDPDGDVVAYDFAVVVSFTEIRQGYRCNAVMNRATGEFWFVPESTDVPTRSFRFVAQDGRGGRDTTGFMVTSR